MVGFVDEGTLLNFFLERPLQAPHHAVFAFLS